MAYDWRSALTDEVNRLAQLAHSRYCRNVYAPLYLCGTRSPATSQWNRLSVATDDEIEASDSLLNLTSEPLPRNLTLGSLADHIRALLAREPLALVAYAGQ